MLPHPAPDRVAAVPAANSLRMFHYFGHFVNRSANEKSVESIGKLLSKQSSLVEA